MDTTYDPGWTMEGFVRWAFGPRHLAYLAVDVDLARRSTDLLVHAREPREVRRRLALLTRAIQATADAHFLRDEAELAGALADLLQAQRFEPWMLERLRDGYAFLERMISGRLAKLGQVLRRSSRRAPLNAAGWSASAPA